MSVRVPLVVIDGTQAARPPDDEACAIVVGNFDGVHKGHQPVLAMLVAAARSAGLKACVLTFDPHPSAVVGGGAPPLLTAMPRRAELMGALGIDCVYVRRFDARFAAWTPDRFASDLLATELHARVVVVGENFRFGAKRSGDLALLRALGQTLGFETQVHPVASDSRGPYSSTRAREAITAGDLDEARLVLGRPHELSGVVVRGDERGRVLGFPTANLGSVPEVLPPDGVYAVEVDAIDGPGGPRRLAGGVTNIGMRPTVGGRARTIETFLFDFSGELYGARLRLQLRSRLRGERKFASLDELKAQIAADVGEARARLSSG
jgi:riboflavin kinase / FMN adenylyltransferase